LFLFFFQAEDGIRDRNVTGVHTCALPISVEDLTNKVGLKVRCCDASNQLFSFERTAFSKSISTVTIARRIHLFPCRTQPLSFFAPRIVRGFPLVKAGRCRSFFASLAQLDRAPDFGSGGWGFESLRMRLWVKYRYISLT